MEPRKSCVNRSRLDETYCCEDSDKPLRISVLLACTSFTISCESNLTGTKKRPYIVLAVGIDVTDGGRNTALVDIYEMKTKLLTKTTTFHLLQLEINDSVSLNQCHPMILV